MISVFFSYALNIVSSFVAQFFTRRISINLPGCTPNPNMDIFLITLSAGKGNFQMTALSEPCEVVQNVGLPIFIRSKLRLRITHRIISGRKFLRVN